MPEKRELTFVEEKSMSLIKDALKDIGEFENINDLIEYYEMGISIFESMLNLSRLIKEGTELTEKVQKAMEESDDKVEVFETAMKDLTALIKKFIYK